MIPENIWPTLISLLINIPLTLLTTFLFNERLKNKRVRKDILIEHIKEALGIIQTESQNIHLLIVNTKAIEELSKIGPSLLLDAEKAKKSELYFGLLGTQAKVQSLLDLIQIQSRTFFKNKESDNIHNRIQTLTSEYSQIWVESIQTGVTSLTDEEATKALKTMNQKFQSVYAQLIELLDKINTY